MRTEKFELKKEKNVPVLYFGDKVIIQGCDELVNLFLTLPLEYPKELKGLGLIEEDYDKLEHILKKGILDNNWCLPNERSL